MASSSSDTASRTPDDLFQEECLPRTTTCDTDTGHETGLLTTSIDLNSEQNSSLLPSLSSKVPRQDSPSLLESSTNVPEHVSLSLFEPSRSSDVPKLDSPSLSAPSSDVPGQDSPSLPAPSSDVPGQESPSFPALSSDGPGQDSPSLPAPSSDVPGQDSPSFPAPSSNVPEQDSPSLPAPSSDIPGQDSPSLPAPSSDVPGQDSPSLPAPSSNVPGQDSPSLPAPSSNVPEQDSPSLPAPSSDIPGQDSPSLPAPSSDIPRQDSPSFPPPSSSDIPGQDSPSLSAISTDVPEQDSLSLLAIHNDLPGQGSPSHPPSRMNVNGKDSLLLHPPSSDVPEEDSPSLPAPSSDVPGHDSPSFPAPSSDVPEQDSPSFPAPSSDVPGQDRPSFPAPSSDEPGQDSRSLPATSSDVPGPDNPLPPAPSSDEPGQDSRSLPATSSDVPGPDNPLPPALSSDVQGPDSPSLSAPSSDVPGPDSPSLSAPSSDVPGPDSLSLSAASSDVPGQDGPLPSAPSNDVPGLDSRSLLPPSCDVLRQDSPSLSALSSDVPGPDRPLDPVTSADFTGKDSPLLSVTASSSNDTGEDMIGLTALATSDGAPGQDSPPISEPGVSYTGLKDPPCIANSVDTEKDCGELAAYSDSDTKQSCLLPEAVAITTSVKIKSSQEPHMTPPLDCRPKVFPGTSKSSSAESGERNTKVTLSFECDENFECEALEGDEEAANSRWENCKKNPGHKKFIPVDDFSLDHLPEVYRKKVFLKGIKSVAKLTVRLRVGFTSANRPNHDYFSWCRGTNIERMGSGYVCTSFANSSLCGLEVPEGCLSQADEDRGLRVHCEAKFGGSSTDLWLHLVKSIVPAFKFVTPELYKFIHASQAARAVYGPNYETIIEECFGSYLNDSTYVDLYSDDQECLLKAKNRLMLLGADSSRLPQELCSDYGEHFWRKAVSKMKTKRLELLFSNYRRLEKELKCLKELYNNMKEILGSIGDEDDDSDEYDDFSFHDFQNELYEEEFNMEDDVVEDEEDAKGEEEEEENEEKKENVKDNNNDNSKKYSQQSNNPKQERYIITVMTARHLVFNKEEAQNTIVELFCDDESEKGVVQLPVVDVDVYSNVGDFITLMCVTYDRRLFLDINAMLDKMTDNVKKMKIESDTPLAVICSHPHGNFKHVTVGEWTTRYMHQRVNVILSLWTSYLYSTATCPGSSGAPVLILGYKDGTLALDSSFHPHHGTDGQGHNKSTIFYSAEAEVKKMCPEAKYRVLTERRDFRRKTLEDGERVWKECLKITLNLEKYVSNVKSRSQCWKDDFVRNLLYFISLKDDENASGCIHKLINITLEERWSLF